MNNLKLVIFFCTFFNFSCNSQNSTSNSETFSKQCNREVYGTKKYISNLPDYICIPKEYVIDDYIREADLNDDKVIDFLAVKYNKKEEDQINGDSTYWNFYLKNERGLFIKLYTLSNLVPPYIEDVSLEYLVNNRLAERIFTEYPRRLDSRSNSFLVKKDTITLSYKFDDTYGKSFIFIYDEEIKNWNLNKIHYFIGELPMYWWKDNKYYYPLKDDLFILVTLQPKTNISITEFSLIEAFKHREEELTELNDISNILNEQDVDIINSKYKVLKLLELPSSWIY